MNFFKPAFMLAFLFCLPLSLVARADTIETFYLDNVTFVSSQTLAPEGNATGSINIDVTNGKITDSAIIFSNGTPTIFRALPIRLAPAPSAARQSSTSATTASTGSISFSPRRASSATRADCFVPMPIYAASTVGTITKAMRPFPMLITDSSSLCTQDRSR